MTIRTESKIVSFQEPFTLRNVDGIQPAGDYLVDVDDELIEGINHSVYRRVATRFHIPCMSSPQPTKQVVAVNQTDLDAALMKDRHTAA
jgi:hypothetical protein